MKIGIIGGGNIGSAIVCGLANSSSIKNNDLYVSDLSQTRLQELKNNQIEIEKEIIKQETRCILDKCFEIGEKDWAVGVVRAFRSGILDIPFAPSVHTLGKILPARDNDGAIRILNSGNLPFTKEIIDFNNKKIEERAKFENREKSFQMVIDDVYAISKGTLIGRPRNK